MQEWQQTYAVCFSTTFQAESCLSSFALSNWAFMVVCSSFPLLYAAKIFVLWMKSWKITSFLNNLLIYLHNRYAIFLLMRSFVLCVSPATVVLTGLEPNTTYEVRVAAVNGKGQGEFSHMETFQTLPIRKSVSNIIPTRFMTHTSK